MGHLRAEVARLTKERSAVAAWQCATRGARFADSVDPALLDGVRRCSACVENERLTTQAQDISVRLSDAGVPACPIPEAVRWLVSERDRLVSELDAAQVAGIANANLWTAEREAHAQTKAEADHRRNMMGEFQARADRAEAVLRDFAARAEAWHADANSSTGALIDLANDIIDAVNLEANHGDKT